MPVDQKPFDMSGVCSLVWNYQDKLPEEVVSLLFSYMYLQHDALQNDLERDLTYAIGARCLRALIDERKDRQRANN